MKNWLQKLKIDRFLMLLIGVIVLASVLPVQGAAKVGFEHLFFFKQKTAYEIVR